MVGGIDPATAYRMLGEHHLPTMRDELKRALLRRAWSQSVASIAAHEAVSVSTAKHRLDQALCAVFDTLPEPIPRDGYSAATWAGCHVRCCLLAVARELDQSVG